MTSNVTVTTGIGYAGLSPQNQQQQLANQQQYLQQVVYHPPTGMTPWPAGSAGPINQGVGYPYPYPYIMPVQVGHWSAGPVNIIPTPQKNTEFSLEELELAETIMEECDAARAP